MPILKSTEAKGEVHLARTRPFASVEVMISLGSNIEPERHLFQALKRLEKRAEIVKVAPAYRTAPAAGASGPEFLNAALMLRCDHPPAVLKYEVLREIEAELGRRRDTDKNAPRTIDLDIAIYDNWIVEDEDLAIKIPDPDIFRWPHVLWPLAELAPDWVPAGQARSLADLRDAMPRPAGLWAHPTAIVDFENE